MKPKGVFKKPKSNNTKFQAGTLFLKEKGILNELMEGNFTSIKVEFNDKSCRRVMKISQCFPEWPIDFGSVLKAKEDVFWKVIDFDYPEMKYKVENLATKIEKTLPRGELGDLCFPLYEVGFTVKYQDTEYLINRIDLVTSKYGVVKSDNNDGNIVYIDFNAKIDLIFPLFSLHTKVSEKIQVDEDTGKRTGTISKICYETKNYDVIEDNDETLVFGQTEIEPTKKYDVIEDNDETLVVSQTEIEPVAPAVAKEKSKQEKKRKRQKEKKKKQQRKKQQQQQQQK